MARNDAHRQRFFVNRGLLILSAGSGMGILI
jgi:hypothetical protein